MRVLYLLLTLAAITTAVWYVAFYEPDTPGATYHSTYAYISIGAAVIFAGLFVATLLGRERARTNQLLD
jgi:hypothetical protein